MTNTNQINQRNKEKRSMIWLDKKQPFATSRFKLKKIWDDERIEIVNPIYWSFWGVTIS